MPTVSTPSSQLSRICDSSSIRCAGHAEVARHVDQALRVRRVRRADHEHEIDLARERLDGRLAVRRGVADVVLGRPDDGREARLQRGDDAGRLVDRERRLREVRELLACAARAAARRPRRSARARSRRAPRPSCRPLPRGPAWPIRKIVRPWPAKRLASLCTLVTSGQVASIARSWRSAALRCTSGATPCAESTTVAPSGTSSSLSTKIAPCCSSRRTTWMLCTICLRT